MVMWGPITVSSNLVSDIMEIFVSELRDEVEKENTCKSVEELISQFINFNKKVDNAEVEDCDRFIASLDVKALYPSLKSKQCEEAVRETINSSKINIEGINEKELGVFLRRNLSTKEINERNLDYLVPNKLKKPKNTQNKTKTDDEYDSWEFKKDKLSTEELRIMLAEVVAKTTELVVNSHIFKFNNKLYVLVFSLKQ